MAFKQYYIAKGKSGNPRFAATDCTSEYDTGNAYRKPDAAFGYVNASDIRNIDGFNGGPSPAREQLYLSHERQKMMMCMQPWYKK